MTKILRLDARPDSDALMAREILTLSAIVGAALLLIQVIQRLS